MTAVDDAFRRLKTNLEISPAEQDLARSRHHLIRDHVRTRWSLDNDFLTGSYDRHTKTKKLKDVDIFIVVDPDGPQADLANGTGTDAVQALVEVLSTRWTVTADDHVATIEYAGEQVASYDVAPVFARSGGGYLLPHGPSWMATDPSVHAGLVTAKNTECGEGFVPLVKMLKGINRHADEPIVPSFLIEVMALELVLGPFGRYQDEVRFFLASAADRFEQKWPDPAGLGPDVNADLTATQRRTIAQTIRGWLAIAEDALLLEAAGKERAAVDRWRELFGWRMPYA